MSENLKNPIPENKSKFPVFVLAFIGLALIGYCIFGGISLLAPKTVTPEISEETTQQKPSNAAQTLIDESSQWVTVFDEDFDSNFNVNGWGVGNGSSEDMESNLEIQDGKYTWDVTSKNTFLVHLSPITAPPVTDFKLSADIKLTSGTYEPIYGVLFRDDPNGDFYFFGIHGETFVIEKYIAGSYTRFVDSQKSSAILPDGTNKLTVIAKGPQFVFLINDQYVYELVDDSIEKGGVGYGVEFNEADLHNTFEFDNFVVQFP